MDRKPRGKPALASSGTCSPPTSAAQAQLVRLFPHLPAAGAPAPGREPVLYANQHAPFARGLLLVREWQVTWVCPIGMKEAGDGLCVGEGFPIRRRGQRGASSAVPGPPAAAGAQPPGEQAARSSRQAGKAGGEAGVPAGLWSRCWGCTRPRAPGVRLCERKEKVLIRRRFLLPDQAGPEPAAGLTPRPVALSSRRGTHGGRPSACPGFLPARLSPPASVPCLSAALRDKGWEEGKDFWYPCRCHKQGDQAYAREAVHFKESTTKWFSYPSPGHSFVLTGDVWIGGCWSGCYQQASYETCPIVSCVWDGCRD